MIKPWPNGSTITSLIAGTNVTIDDPAGPEPTINSSSGGGTVDSIVAGSGIAVDDTDPTNPIVSTTGGGGGLESVVGGTDITIDDTDPLNPIINSTATVEPVASLSGAGLTESPGVLDQAGGLSITDLQSDGVSINSINELSFQTTSIINLQLNGTSTIALTGNGYGGLISIGSLANSGGQVQSFGVGLPAVIEEGVNDTFVYTPISTNTPDTYTIAPGTYNNTTDFTNAIGEAVDSDSNNFFQVATPQPAASNFITIVGAVGDILSSGPTDALLTMGYDSPAPITTAFSDDTLSYYGAGGIVGPQVSGGTVEGVIAVLVALGILSS